MELEVNEKVLKQFGLTLAGILAGVLGVILPSLRAESLAWKPVWVALGAAFGLWAWIAPGSLAGVYRGWMRVAHLISGVVNRVFLAVLFFGMITPIGLVRRLRNRDPLGLAWDPEAKSYRVPSCAREKDHFRRMF
ncbi:MAG: hypothetical protein D6771_02695 [Zetaproteobacteria bacterium]|nr:MAG: hypothetical protein D6771_02695 [Zetaproteobacteria bacterium]